MSKVFIIVGYGVPKQILKDENYNIYLKVSLNKIWDISAKSNGDPAIVFSGGPTDLVKPYRRTEAGEMKKLFKHIISEASLNAKTANWRYLLENKSLSSLENIIYSHNLLKSKKLLRSEVYFICEQTRFERINKLSHQVFRGSAKVRTIPIDFDISANRYLDPNFIHDKNKTALKFELLALKDKDIYKKYINAHKVRIRRFRDIGPDGHLEAIQDWWQETMEEFYDLAR